MSIYQIEEATYVKYESILENHIKPVQTLIRETGNFNRKARENVKRQNEAIAEQVEVLRKKNVKNLYFIKEDQFLGTDHEGTVDGTHPNDLGFDRMLKKYKPAISKILKIKFKAE